MSRRTAGLVVGAGLIAVVVIVVVRLNSSPDPNELKTESRRLVDDSIRQAGLDPSTMEEASGSIPCGADMLGGQRDSVTFRRSFGQPPDDQARRLLEQVRRYWASAPEQISIIRDGSTDRTPVVRAKSGDYSLEAIIGAEDGFEVSVTSPCARLS